MILPLLASTIVVGGPAKPISPDLFGIFFEDISYSADGGLYAELVQNRSFEYSALDHAGWHGLTGWTFVKEEGGEGRMSLRSGATALNANNPHSVAIFAEKGCVGIRNEGFGGMVLRKGASYDLSLFTCTLAGTPGPITVRLENAEGRTLASATLPGPTSDWSKAGTTLVPDADAKDGRLVVLTSGVGTTGLDMVSLFPRDTFKGRKNGLRPDLAGAIADLKPKFVRFPGGCVVHGGWLGLRNLYDWKETVGPVETRRAQPNQWGYHQTMGIGYYEYFQFCEDIGAKPLPVVPAAVSCQNTDTNWGKGQEAIPMAGMKAYIQDVLDLVEWANGPATSKWGRVRAAAGHPKPFGLEYLAIGNEEAITPLFAERFKMVHDAVKRRYPKLKLIGTVGPFPDGPDYEEGWKIARRERLGMVDEHYYKSPDWFWETLTRYDGYDRASAKVYAGEYASHEENRANTLRSALAEAAHLTSLERNGDVVRLASYAPLLAKQGHVNWRPDLIYFDNSAIYRSLNYEVQRLFMHNSGDLLLPATVGGEGIAASVVQDSATGDVVVKLVSRAAAPVSATVDLSAVKGIRAKGTTTVLTGDPMAENAYGEPARILPRTSEFAAAPVFPVELPPSSLTVIRLKTR